MQFRIGGVGRSKFADPGQKNTSDGVAIQLWRNSDKNRTLNAFTRILIH
jgi:hypothetical protein